MAAKISDMKAVEDLLDLAATDADGAFDDGGCVIKRSVLDLAVNVAAVVACVHLAFLENRVAQHAALGRKLGPVLTVKTIKVKAGSGLVIEINLAESEHAGLFPNGDILVNRHVRTAPVFQESADINIHGRASFPVSDHIPGGEIGAVNHGSNVEQLRAGLLGKVRGLPIGVVGFGADGVRLHRATENEYRVGPLVRPPDGLDRAGGQLREQVGVLSGGDAPVVVESVRDIGVGGAANDDVVGKVDVIGVVGEPPIGRHPIVACLGEAARQIAGRRRSHRQEPGVGHLDDQIGENAVGYGNHGLRSHQRGVGDTAQE